MAKRVGRKSKAQTPAPPKERIFGSKKNPKGSASSEKSASKIRLNKEIIKGLENKLAKFKEENPNKKNVNLNDLKAVFRRGLGAYSSSHRPTITGGVPNTRNAWAFARVNKFLKKASGDKVKKAYVQDDDLLKMEKGGGIPSLTKDEIDFLNNWISKPINASGVLRKFMDKEDIKIANALVKKGWMEKGISSDKPYSVFYYLDLPPRKLDEFENLLKGQFANGGEIPKYRFVGEQLESDEVEAYFDSDWKRVYKWDEGKGRGISNYTIYYNGDKYLLEMDFYGFDDYISRYSYIELDEPNYADGGEVNEKEKYIDEYFKRLEFNRKKLPPKLLRYWTKMASREYEKEKLKQLPYRQFKVTFSIPAGAIYHETISARTFNEAKTEFRKRHGRDIQGNLDKIVSVKLIKDKKFANGGEVDKKVLRERWAKKKDALENLANNISRLRKNLSKDLKEGNEKEKLTALVVKIMDETGERVGNEESANNGHFGVTGLKKNHIKINGSRVKFKYVGKSGVEHEKELNDYTIASALKQAMSQSPSEYVFETSEGFRIKNDRVNRYLNIFNVSAKDLRGYSANKWIINKLKSVKDKEILNNDAKRKKKFNEIVKSVAEKVGHGSATLKKHYLLPSLEREFVNHGKIVDLSNIKRTYKHGGETDEVNTGVDVIHNIDADPLDELKDIPNDGEGVFARGGNIENRVKGEITIYSNGSAFVTLKSNYGYKNEVGYADIYYVTIKKYFNKPEQKKIIDALTKKGVNPNSKIRVIEFLEIYENYRGKGYASYLLKEIIKYYKEAGDKYLVLSVGQGSDAPEEGHGKKALSHKALFDFYSRHGFESILEGENYMIIDLEKVKFDKGGKLLGKYAFVNDDFDGYKVARRLQSTNENEPANKLEKQLYKDLERWQQDSTNYNANKLYSNKNIFDKLATQYPKIFKPSEKFQYVYRGISNLEYKYVRDIIWQLYNDKIELSDFVKIDDVYFLYTKPFDYKPERNAQSWTKDIDVALSFSRDAMLITKKDDNFIMNYQYYNAINEVQEDELIHLGKEFDNNVYIMFRIQYFVEKFLDLPMDDKASNYLKKLKFAEGGRLKKLASGYYEGEYKGVKFQITRQEKNAYGGKPMWYYEIYNEALGNFGRAHDLYFTKQQAVESAKEEIDTRNDKFAEGGKTQIKEANKELVEKTDTSLLLPTYTIEDVKTYVDDLTREDINDILDKLNMPFNVVDELGSGANGIAWQTNRGTVLKITKSGQEAYSSYIIFKNQENFSSQAEIYNLFVVIDLEDLEKYYFIEKQLLRPARDVMSDELLDLYRDIEMIATYIGSKQEKIDEFNQLINDEDLNLDDIDKEYAEQIFELAMKVKEEAKPYGLNLNDNHSGNVGFDWMGKLYCFDCGYVEKKSFLIGGNLNNKLMLKFKDGGEITQEDKKEIYAKWRKLVNMSRSELERFYNSEEGKVAGLTPQEAEEAGIDSGRESARWIMKMKSTKVADWTPMMWKWAKKQISFISRMSGNKGKLVDENGAKTRKHLSLLIWGHNPNKKGMGGDVEEPCHVCSMSEGGYNQLPSLTEMADGKRFIYREDVFRKGGDTNTHVGSRYMILECMGEGGITDTLNLKVIQSSDGLLPNTMITRPIRNIINRGREMGERFGKTIVGSYKKGGELNPDDKKVKNYFEHKSGEAGGLLVGKRHSEGGIKAINHSTGQPLEMEGGEVVITRDAVSDSTKREFEGKYMTNREILSAINVSGGGVAFAEGGETPDRNC